jgi:glycosyltransferase involved in cell wall biosynthesis
VSHPTAPGGAPLRVLVLHNRHRAAIPSGENRAVDYEVELLREAGVEVETHQPSNDEIDTWSLPRRLGVARRPLWSPEEERRVARLIERFRPHVVHLHNAFPLLTPRVLRAASGAGIPTVQTVHDYLHVCAAGTFLREGRRCYDCRDRAYPWPAVVHRCYHHSAPQSAILAAALVVARPTWQRVDRFLPVSQTVADHLVAAGIPASRVTVKFNAVPDPGEPAPPGDSFLFAVRLRAEKGLDRLLAAWVASGAHRRHRLRVAGDGPLRAVAEAAARDVPGVEYLGLASPERVGELMGEAGVILLPSIWDEPLPLTAIEALSHGRAVIASHAGGLVDLIDAEVGWSVEDGVEPLAAALREATQADLARLGAAARRRYLERLSPQRVVEQLLGIYAELRRDAVAA